MIPKNGKINWIHSNINWVKKLWFDGVSVRSIAKMIEAKTGVKIAHPTVQLVLDEYVNMEEKVVRYHRKLSKSNQKG